MPGEARCQLQWRQWTAARPSFNRAHFLSAFEPLSKFRLTVKFRSGLERRQHCLRGISTAGGSERIECCGAACADAGAGLLWPGAMGVDWRHQASRDDSGDWQWRYSHARRCLAHWLPRPVADAVMIGQVAHRPIRGSFARSRMNTRPAEAIVKPTEFDRYNLIRTYFSMLLEQEFPDATGKMKQFASWFTHGVPGGAGLRKAIYEAKTGPAIIEAVERFFAFPATRFSVRCVARDRRSRVDAVRSQCSLFFAAALAEDETQKFLSASVHRARSKSNPLPAKCTARRPRLRDGCVARAR